MPITINNKGNKTITNHILNNTIHLSRTPFSGTLTSTWVGTEAPYSQAVSVTGLLASDVPVIDMVNSGTYATDKVRNEEWSKVYRAVPSANTITFYANDKTTVSIPFQMMVVRNNV